MTPLYHLFPPTIHPMVIHFTIALVYLSALAGFVGLFARRDYFYVKAYLLMLGLAIVATIAAGIAGVISESYVNPAVHHVTGLLAVHKRDGELTGVLLVIAFGAQAVLQRLRRVSLVAFIFTLGATAMVSVTGFLGGSMVYDHGLGVQAVHTAANAANAAGSAALSAQLFAGAPGTTGR